MGMQDLNLLLTSVFRIPISRYKFLVYDHIGHEVIEALDIGS